MEADPLAPWMLAVKLGLYASALLAAGLVLQASLGIVEREGRARVLRSAALLSWVALIFAGLRLAITSMQLGGSIESIYDADTLAWTWPALAPSTTAIVAGVVGLNAAWLSRAVLPAAPAAVAIAASFALTGHSQALETPGLAPWGVGAHVLIAAFWFAAPITLWPGPALSDDALTRRAERFTQYALFAIPILFALGLWLAWLLAGGVDALLTRLYGQLLLAKLTAATAVLALGAYNKQVVTRKLREMPDVGRRALAVTLTLDGLLFAAALVLVGVATTLTGPPTN
ncbi:MAG: CopD family protein [Hyphomonadaceae bacterium]